MTYMVAVRQLAGSKRRTEPHEAVLGKVYGGVSFVGVSEAVNEGEVLRSKPLRQLCRKLHRTNCFVNFAGNSVDSLLV